MMNPNMFDSNNTTEINHFLLDQDHSNSYDLYFPDPDFLDDDDLFFSRFLSQQQVVSGGDSREEEDQDRKQTKPNSDKAAKKKKCRKIGSSTKRTGKKDRHSKICTAQGPRDRRMRLSLQIARKFFNLQDMLGFDKASKTIDWLLSNSNSAITDLKHRLNDNNNNNNDRSYSYGSVCSGSSEVINNGGGGRATTKEATTRQLRIVAKEARDRARARARERTMLKKTHQDHDQNFCFNFQHGNSDQLQDQDIHHKLLAISDDLSDFPSIQSFFSSGNNNDDTQLQNHDYSSLSCPNSIFMASPIPKPYSFSDSTLLNCPNFK